MLVQLDAGVVSVGRGLAATHCVAMAADCQLMAVRPARMATRSNGTTDSRWTGQVRQCKKGLKEFVQSEVDPDSVPYKDRVREKLRLADARKAAKAGLGRHAVREAAKQQRAVAAAAAAKEAEKKKLPAAKRKTLQHREDLVDLNDDYRLLKKLKKGKISDKEYLEAMNVDL